MPLPQENLFSLTFPEAIWRILPHPERDEWVVELRNAAQKTVSWALVDLALNKIVWQEAPSATEWWTTLAGFAGDGVFLHNYRFHDIPEPTDLLALSAAEGELRWALPGWLFGRAAPEEGQIIVTQKQAESIQQRFCDSELGLLKDVIEEQNLLPITAPNHRSPVRYGPEDIYFAQLSSFLAKTVGVKDVIAVDYLESDPYLVFSYYLSEPEKTTQSLLVVNRNRETIYHNRLSDNRPGMSHDTILLQNDRLVFLRNTNELISLTLTH
ncbi:DUF4905 domain-containing protein [Persicitalea sp.]|uniref:DUF4905 domain-containing protein n=1 Tax=Persicitalea sp. TaxID=3100273 RepID=UPI0035931FA2